MFLTGIRLNVIIVWNLVMISKIKFWFFSDRLGPDLPFTHKLLYFKSLGFWLCKRKFQKFGRSSEVRAGAFAVCTKSISVGANVVIRPQTMLFASPDISEHKTHIEIQDNVLIGSGCHIYVSNHKFDDPGVDIAFQGHSPVKPVVLERGCWLGANVIVLPGVRIGQNAVVGAGSVVTKNIEPYSIAVGNPARVISKVDKT